MEDFLKSKKGKDPKFKVHQEKVRVRMGLIEKVAKAKGYQLNREGLVNQLSKNKPLAER
jgi:hypothetical protein